MKKNARRLCSLLCATLFVLAALIGCSSQSSPTAAPTSAPATATEAATAAPAETATVAPAAASWDTASWKNDTSPVTLSMLVDISWYSMTSWGNDDASKEITKLTGVSLNVSKTTDSSQLSVMIAANNLPDLTVTENTTSQLAASSPSVSYAWDDLINQYCPEFQQLLDPTMVANNTMTDGHYYTIKSFYSTDAEWANPADLPSPGATGFSIRKDIYDALGDPALNSIEDLLSLFDQVHAKYPKMQIFAMNLQNEPIFQEWMNICDWEPFIDTTTDTVKHPLDNPQSIWVDYLQLMNSLYLKGYLNPENFTYQNDQFNQIISSGNVFSVSGPGAGDVDYINQQMYANKIPGEMVWVKPLTWKGQMLYKPTDFSSGWTGLYISKECTNPQRAVLFCEFLRDPVGQKLTQWGVEGKEYTLDANGNPIPTPYYLGLPSDQVIQVTGAPNAWYWQGSPLLQSLMNEGVANAEAASGSTGPAPQDNDYLAVVKQYTVRQPVLSRCVTIPGSDEATIESKLTDLMNTGLPPIYMAKSASDVQTMWNTLYANAKQIGLDKLEAYYTAQYQQYKSMYAK